MFSAISVKHRKLTYSLRSVLVTYNNDSLPVSLLFKMMNWEDSDLLEK